MDRRRSKQEAEAVVTALAQLGEPRRPVAKRPKRRPVRDPLANWMRRRGWNYDTPSDGLRRRLYCLVNERWPWWDWGHRLMVLTGSDHGGNWSEPEPPTWWYRLGPPKRMWRTRYPRHPLSTFQVVADYSEFRRLTEGLNEDQMYEWSAIGVNQDGTLLLGWQYWGGGFYGLASHECALLRRYLRLWRLHDWFGLRSWLYAQGLHAAVHRRKPFACQAIPPPGSGGYRHWYCGEKRRHRGDHRFGNYTWAGGETRVTYATTEPSGA